MEFEINGASVAKTVAAADKRAPEKARIEFNESHPRRPLTFSEAFEALKAGKKIKLSSWKGYWKMERDVYSREGKNTIHMHCKDGRVLDIRDTQDVMFTVGNMATDDWEIVD